MRTIIATLLAVIFLIVIRVTHPLRMLAGIFAGRASAGGSIPDMLMSYIAASKAFAICIFVDMTALKIAALNGTNTGGAVPACMIMALIADGAVIVVRIPQTSVIVLCPADGAISPRTEGMRMIAYRATQFIAIPIMGVLISIEIAGAVANLTIG